MSGRPKPCGNCERCMKISWRREPKGETSPGYSRIVEAYRCEECGREFVAAAIRAAIEAAHD